MRRTQITIMPSHSLVAIVVTGLGCACANSAFAEVTPPSIVEFVRPRLTALSSLTLPPVVIQDARLVASDPGSFDNFAEAVALDGDNIVVGAADADGAIAGVGAAYVFSRSGLNWVQQAKIFAPPGTPLVDDFGTSVAISGDMVVVGSPMDDASPAEQNTGSAYVFVRSGATWAYSATLTADDAIPNDRLGRSVAISGDWIAVGADGVDGPGGNAQGGVYFFQQQDSVWMQRYKYVDPDGIAVDNLGRAIAMQGETCVVGAFGADGPAGAEQGAAYVFNRDNDTWTLTVRLQPADLTQGSYFGSGVAVDGDTLAVGAFLDDGPAGNSQGAAYVFVRDPPTWSLQAKLRASDAQATEWFGFGIGLVGDRLFVSSPFDANSTSIQGSIYPFTRSGSTWTEHPKFFASEIYPTTAVGWSLAYGGEFLIAGAPYNNGPVSMEQGNAYMWRVFPCCLGDFDGNGQIAIPDVPYFAQALLEPILNEGQLCAADINRDGVVNGNDIPLFTRKLFFFSTTCP